MDQKDCIFCRIASREIDSRLVFEDDQVVAFHDLVPQAPTHILIIPRKHYDSVMELEDPAIAGRLLLAARKIARQLQLTDFRLVVNTGVTAGQSVFHLHLHLLSGRKMTWPPG